MKKIAIAMVALVAIPVAGLVTFFVYKTIASAIVGGDFAEVHQESFVCQKIGGSRVGYVYVRGFGEDDPYAAHQLIEAAKTDVRNVGFLDYDYDEDLFLGPIVDIFLQKLEDFIATKKPDSLIIFAHSAGGIVVSDAAHRLGFGGPVQIHTMASPLAGYNVMDAFLGERSGYLRQIAGGIDPYEKPADNVSGFHHKTITDHVLVEFCGSAQKFCKPLKVQNNNLPGSVDFYYPNARHNSIIMQVVDAVMSCQQ